MKFKLGDFVCKIKGSQWTGYVVGTYSTELTPEGYCVESYYYKGTVQIYPAAALEKIIPCNDETPHPGTNCSDHTKLAHPSA